MLKMYLLLIFLGCMMHVSLADEAMILNAEWEIDSILVARENFVPFMDDVLFPGQKEHIKIDFNRDTVERTIVSAQGQNVEKKRNEFARYRFVFENDEIIVWFVKYKEYYKAKYNLNNNLLDILHKDTGFNYSGKITIINVNKLKFTIEKKSESKNYVADLFFKNVQSKEKEKIVKEVKSFRRLYFFYFTQPRIVKH